MPALEITKGPIMRRTQVHPRVLMALVLCFFASVASAETTMKFTISGGQVVELPVSDKGPLPATAEGVKVEIAGPIFGPSKTGPDKAALIWAFTLSVPKDGSYSSLVVEDVSGPQAKTVASQDQPAIRSVKAPDEKELHILQLRGLPADISPETTPWVYQPGTTTIVFRVTLKSTSGKTLTLHQPTMFGDEPKAQIQQMAMKAAGRADEPPDLVAEAGHCGAVYGLSAKAATDAKEKGAFEKQARRMDAVVEDELGGDAPLIKVAALQSLTEMLKGARSRNEATGAADLLKQRQAFCASLQERLPK